MANSRTKNATLIAFTSVIGQILNIGTQFISRTVFIYILGAEYLGLNGLFSNILSILSLTELGIGAAISFYLYKPIVKHDYERIKSLLVFYKICYRVIGLTMIAVGMIISPFLPVFVNFNQKVPVNLHLVYFLYLLNIALTYLMYAYKQALPMANQEQYKIEKINIIFIVINCITDVLVLVLFRKYIPYLLAKIILVLIKNISISRRIDKEYPYITEKNVEKIDKHEVISFFKDLKNVALFKIGSTLYNSTDNIIISKMLGTIVVGYYSNYFLIISSVTTFVSLVVKSCVAGIGNIIVNESKENQYNYFRQIDYAAYIIVSIASISLFQLLNSFIKVWIGKVDNNYMLSQIVILFLCISFYLDGTTQIMNLFREASGNFKLGRNNQIAGGICNIILSIVLGKIYGLEGIFASTVICKFFISLFPFMINISKDVFGKKMYVIFVRHIIGASITIFTAIIVWHINIKNHMTTVGGFIIEIITTVFVACLIPSVIFWNTYEARQNVERIKLFILKEGKKRD